MECGGSSRWMCVEPMALTKEGERESPDEERQGGHIHGTWGIPNPAVLQTAGRCVWVWTAGTGDRVCSPRTRRAVRGRRMGFPSRFQPHQSSASLRRTGHRLALDWLQCRLGCESLASHEYRGSRRLGESHSEELGRTLPQSISRRKKVWVVCAFWMRTVGCWIQVTMRAIGVVNPLHAVIAHLARRVNQPGEGNERAEVWTWSHFRRYF